MDNMHLKIKMDSLNGVFRQTVHMELLDLELDRRANDFCSILGLEIAARLVLMVSIFINLDGGIGTYPISRSVVEISVRTFGDVILDVHLFEVIL
jgi:hypothetical protein